jgi:hypothetical protein
MNDQESIEVIRQRMQQVRRDLSHEVHHLVASARDMTDWRQYVRAYPWLCAAAAAAAGYWIVPAGSPRFRLKDTDLDSLAERARTQLGDSTRPAPGWGATVTKAVALAAMRGLLGYVTHRYAVKTAVEENGAGRA